MSGHNKWASIKHKKGANDAKRGKLWSRIAKELTLAAREGGGDAETNAKLRVIIAKAKSANMPNDNIDRAIKRGTGEFDDGTVLEEIIYEGYGPGGVAVMLDIATDNKNRTAAEIRSIFSKNGGSLGENGCVAWSFNRKALFTVDATKYEEDSIMEMALEAGAEDIENEDDVYSITAPVESFSDLAEAFKNNNIETLSADITRIAENTIKVEGSEAKRVLKMLDLLEDHDDVQSVSANFDIDDSVFGEMEE